MRPPRFQAGSRAYCAAAIITAASVFSSEVPTVTREHVSAAVQRDGRSVDASSSGHAISTTHVRAAATTYIRGTSHKAVTMLASSEPVCQLPRESASDQVATVRLAVVPVGPWP